MDVFPVRFVERTAVIQVAHDASVAGQLVVQETDVLFDLQYLLSIFHLTAPNVITASDVQ